MLGQHKLLAHENEVPGTHGDGVTAEKFVSRVKEWTTASLARAVTAREPGVFDWLVQ